MERILFSPNPSDRSQDFMVINGTIENDKFKRSKIGKEIVDYDNLKKLFSDDFCTVYKGDDFIVLRSLYKERDEANRLIYYVYKIDSKIDIEEILNHLEKDSKAIERTFDREAVVQILSNIKKSPNYKLLALTLAAVITAVIIAGICLIFNK
ncbi:hypothetical protein ACTS91_12630 [Empedobacter falsenii]